MSSYVFKSIIGNVEVVAFNKKVSSVKLTRKKTTRTKDKLLLRAAFQINRFLIEQTLYERHNSYKMRTQ